MAAYGYYYRWKSFSDDEDRPEKPRRFGLTEMRSPDYTLMGNHALQVNYPLLAVDLISIRRLN